MFRYFGGWADKIQVLTLIDIDKISKLLHKLLQGKVIPLINPDPATKLFCYTRREPVGSDFTTFMSGC